MATTYLLYCLYIHSSGETGLNEMFAANLNLTLMVNVNKSSKQQGFGDPGLNGRTNLWQTDSQDRRTDGRTRWIQYPPPPQTSLCGGINIPQL